IDLKPLRLPKGMSARQRRVTTKRHFHRWSEPAQVKAVGLRQKKRGLGKVHFARDGLHPTIVARSIQKTNRRRISGERSIGKSIDLIDWQPHRHLFRTSMVGSTESLHFKLLAI